MAFNLSKLFGRRDAATESSPGVIEFQNGDDALTVTVDGKFGPETEAAAGALDGDAGAGDEPGTSAYKDSLTSWGAAEIDLKGQRSGITADDDWEAPVLNLDSGDHSTASEAVQQPEASALQEAIQNENRRFLGDASGPERAPGVIESVNVKYTAMAGDETGDTARMLNNKNPELARYENMDVVELSGGAGDGANEKVQMQDFHFVRGETVPPPGVTEYGNTDDAGSDGFSSQTKPHVDGLALEFAPGTTTDADGIVILDNDGETEVARMAASAEAPLDKSSPLLLHSMEEQGIYTGVNDGSLLGIRGGEGGPETSALGRENSIEILEFGREGSIEDLAEAAEAGSHRFEVNVDDKTLGVRAEIDKSTPLLFRSMGTDDPATDQATILPYVEQDNLYANPGGGLLGVRDQGGAEAARMAPPNEQGDGFLMELDRPTAGIWNDKEKGLQEVRSMAGAGPEAEPGETAALDAGFTLSDDLVNEGLAAKVLSDQGSGTFEQFRGGDSQVQEDVIEHVLNVRDEGGQGAETSRLSVPAGHGDDQVELLGFDRGTLPPAAAEGDAVQDVFVTELTRSGIKIEIGAAGYVEDENQDGDFTDRREAARMAPPPRQPLGIEAEYGGLDTADETPEFGAARAGLFGDGLQLPNQLEGGKEGLATGSLERSLASGGAGGARADHPLADDVAFRAGQPGSETQALPEVGDEVLVQFQRGTGGQQGLKTETEVTDYLEGGSTAVRSEGVKWEGADFDASKNEVAIETLEIAHEGINAQTPADWNERSAAESDGPPLEHVLQARQGVIDVGGHETTHGVTEFQPGGSQVFPKFLPGAQELGGAGGPNPPGDGLELKTEWITSARDTTFTPAALGAIEKVEVLPDAAVAEPTTIEFPNLDADGDGPSTLLDLGGAHAASAEPELEDVSFVFHVKAPDADAGGSVDLEGDGFMDYTDDAGLD